MNSKGKCDADLPSVVRLEGLAFHPDDTDPVCTQNLSAAASLMSCSVLDDEEINDEPETCELADQGKELFKEGQYLAACVHFSALINRQSVSGGGPDVKTISNRCAAASKAGLCGVALKDGQACVDQQPHAAKAYFRLGEAYYAQEMYAKAYTCFKSAQALSPWDSIVFQHILKAKQRAGLASVVSGAPDSAAWIQHFGSTGLVTWGERPRGLHRSGQNLLRQPYFIDNLRGRHITKVAVGTAHVLATDVEGTVFAWGSNEHHQLGFGADHPLSGQDTNIPVMVPSLFKSQVVDLACGGFHSIAVTSAGEILSWGCGSKGQLGHGDPTTLPKPKRIEALWKPKLFEQFMAKDKQTKRGPAERLSVAVRIGVSVSCGEAHTAVLICNKLYMFGDNNRGQLGIPGVGEAWTPMSVQLWEYEKQHPTQYGLSPPDPDDESGDDDSKAKHEEAGPRVSFAANRTGGGYNFDPVIITEDGSGDSELARRLRRLMKAGNMFWKRRSKPRSVQCGYRFTTVIDHRHRLWTWGCNSSGQLGYDCHATLSEQLRRTTIATQGLDELHSEDACKLARLPNDCMLTPHRVPFFDTAYQQHPTDVGSQATVDAVACGEAFTVVIAEKRRSVWSFGCGAAGQLGTDQISPKSVVPRCVLRSTDVPAPELNARAPPRVPVASQVFSGVSCGPEHAKVVTNSGAVYMWGSGIVPHFFKFDDELKVESGQFEALDTRKSSFKASRSRSTRKGASVLFAHTLDASQKPVLASTSSENIPDVEFSTAVGLEAGAVPRQVRMKDRKIYEPSPEEGMILEIADRARHRGFWNSLEDRERYREVMKKAKEKENEALKKWIYLGCGSTALFLEAYKGGGTNDVCFIPFENRPDREDPDKPAPKDARTVLVPTLLVAPTNYPVIESVVCGSRFGFALLRGPDPTRCEVVSARPLSPDALDALIDAKFAAFVGKPTTAETASGDGFKVLDKFLMEYRPPVPVVLYVPCGEEVVLEVEVRDFEGELWIHGKPDVEAQLVHLSKNWTVPCDVTNLFDGTVVIAANVKAKGVHQLQVSISGVPVKGSPMTVIGKSDCELCVAKSEVFPLDGLGRRTDVASICDHVFLAHHSGSSVEQWALPSHAIRSAQIDNPQLLETAFGASLDVSYIPHEALRFGVILRDKFGNQLSDSSGLSTVVGKIRKVLAKNESVDVLDMKFAPSKTDVISLTAHMPLGCVEQIDPTSRTEDTEDVMKHWNCRVVSLMDNHSVVSSTSSVFAPVLHDMISEAFVIEGRISQRGRYTLFFAKETDVRNSESKRNQQPYAYSPTSLRQLSKSITTGVRERPNKPLDGLPLTRMSWIFPTFELQSVPGAADVRLCSLCSVPPHALIDFVGGPLSSKFVRWLTVSRDGVLTVSPQPHTVTGDVASGKIKKDTNDGILGAIHDDPMPPSQLQSLTSIRLQVLDNEAADSMSGSSPSLSRSESETSRDAGKSRRKHHVVGTSSRSPKSQVHAKELQPVASPVRTSKQTPLRRVGSASLALASRHRGRAVPIEKPIVRLPSGWFVVPQPTAEEIAAETARKHASEKLRREKRKELRHASVEVADKSTWSGNPTIVLASVDDVHVGDDDGSSSELNQSTGLASLPAVDLSSPGLSELGAAVDCDHGSLVLGQGELFAGAVCVLFLQLLDHKRLPTSRGKVRCDLSMQPGKSTSVPWQATTNSPPSPLLPEQYELYWFRVPESFLATPPSTHLVGMIRSFRRMTGASSQRQPDSKTAPADPSSIYCLVFTTKCPTSCLLSITIDGVAVAHSPVRLSIRPVFPIALLTAIVDDSGLSICDAEARVISDDLLAQLDSPMLSVPSDSRLCPYVHCGLWRHVTFESADVWGNPTCVALTAMLQRLDPMDETWDLGLDAGNRHHHHQVYKLASDGVKQAVRRTVEQALVECWDATVVYNSITEDVMEKQECCHWLQVTSDEGRVEIEQDSDLPAIWRVRFRALKPGRYRLVVTQTSQLIEDSAYHFLARDEASIHRHPATGTAFIGFSDYKWLMRRTVVQFARRQDCLLSRKHFKDRHMVDWEASVGPLLTFAKKQHQSCHERDEDDHCKRVEQETAVRTYHEYSTNMQLLSHFRQVEASSALEKRGLVLSD